MAQNKPHEKVLKRALENIDPICETFSRAAGYRYYQLMVSIPLDPTCPTICNATSYPIEWLHKYRQAKHVHADPIMECVVGGIEPFQWSSLVKDDPAAQAFFRDAASFGLRDGITAPLYGPGGAHGVFSMSDAATPPAGSAELETQMRDVLRFANRMFAYVLQVGYSAELRPRRGMDLTVRQKQVARYMAKGHTYREIGERLGIKPGTVQDLAERICEKLGVENREQAIIRAVHLGYVHPSADPVRYSVVSARHQ